MTEVGGDIVAAEVTRMRQEDFILTGQLGEVMRDRPGLPDPGERTRWASSARSSRRTPLHIHVPPGRSPRRPVGVTMATAMVSALTGPGPQGRGDDRRDPLRGRVLPIGGLKSKICRPPVRREDGPAEEEREGPRHSEEIRKETKLIRRLDGPVLRRPPAPTQAAARGPPARSGAVG